MDYVCSMCQNLPHVFSLSGCVGEKPSLDLLWFGRGPEVPALRLTSFLSIFDCHDFSSLYGNIEDSMLTALCLVTYIALQVVSPSYWTFFFMRWSGGGVRTNDRESKEVFLKTKLK